MRGILGFLDNDSIFGRICTVIGTIIVVNLLFIVTLLPIITAGAGFTAMYYAMLKLARYKEINPFLEFWEGFKSNFKRATLAELIIIALFVFLIVDYRICSQMTGVLSFCILAVYVAMIALTITTMYLFPVMASFYGNIREQIKYSVFFAGSNMLGTICIAALNIIPLLLTYSNPQMLPLAAFLWCIGGFAFIALCNSMIMLRRFNPYLDPIEMDEEQADMKKILEDMRRLEG